MAVGVAGVGLVADVGPGDGYVGEQCIKELVLVPVPG